MPSVVCTAAIDDERLSCTADEDGRTHWQTWQTWQYFPPESESKPDYQFCLLEATPTPPSRPQAPP